MAELDPLETYQMFDEQKKGGEEESQARDSPMEVDGGNWPHGGISLPSVPVVPSFPHEDVDLPESPSHGSQDDPGPIPQVGVNWNNMDVILSHYPSRQAERAQRVREVI